ncbi:hypothetical protein LZZ85_01545 [Terrimonas sp. NA20]|uniref:DUF4843 domain-containing protein n=1 Tax=Terrimonas ginsenosidimutans TaxID=2908004 RepID=A0ABS9KKT9_9BACT|nr:hypothetical protein [Terrimonas ginsenosidimutans]MCG2612935.1 hypothetical protein [Terrimonas ginsenosidimutans]
MKRTILLSGIACLLLTASCKKHQDPLIELRNNWYSFISAEIPGYHFIGFESNQLMDLPVTNNTDFTIDEIVVSVNYIGKTGEIRRSEELSLFNVPPHSVRSVQAPYAPADMAMDIQFRNITSKQMSFAYPGSSTNATDPYFFH